MSILEILQLLFIWVTIGCFICYKRKWYVEKDKGMDTPPAFFYIMCTIICMPIALVVALFREFILDEWNNAN